MSLGIIFSSKESDWKSCTRIVSNIFKAYKELLAEEEFKTYNYSSELSQYEIYKLARKVQEEKVSELIFIDHDPHPLMLLKYLADFGVKIQKVTFHIYGDFTLYLRNWHNTFELLREISVNLVVASIKQKNLLSSLLQSDVNVHVCPFPVDKSIFYLDEDIRKQERKNRNIADDETVFLYTGRISSGKLCHNLLENFAKVCEITPAKSRLYFAGRFDDIVNPILGQYFLSGFYQQKFLSILSKLPKEIQDRVEFLPSLNDEELLRVYNASDTFVSLSLYNDEDFGMSPVEALFCGNNTLLTDWGGYHSYKIEGSNATKLVKTEMTKKGARVSHAAVVKNLLTSILTPRSALHRSEISKFYQDRFSVLEVSRLLKAIHETEGAKETSFSSFARSLLFSKTPFRLPDGKLSKQYLEIYENYAK